MQNINLYIEPRVTVAYNHFSLSCPPDNLTSIEWRQNNHNSITLDGYMSGGPNLWRNERIVNFDHHENVKRFATMSTSKQVYLAIKQGLFDMFQGVKPNVYINDVDQDTAFAVWLLENHYLLDTSRNNAKEKTNIEALLNLTDLLDITAGAYPFDFNSDIAKMHNWVFKPYTDFRTSGALSGANTTQMYHNIDETMGRLTLASKGLATKVEFDTRHEIYFKDDLITIVNEIGGNDARYYLYSQGMKAHISLVSMTTYGHFVYSVGKKSPYIEFDVPGFLSCMNDTDSLPNGEKLPLNERAGGSDTIGGSSRLHGSKHTFEDLKKMYLEMVKK
jgi:hypothetical protein